MNKQELFDWAKREIPHIVTWIQDWFRENGPEAYAVVGISGGKDSGVTAALLARALGKERVVGLLIPNGRDHDIEDARETVEVLGIPYKCVNISGATEALQHALYEQQMFVRKPFPAYSMTSDAQINLLPRLRMLVLYAMAQSLHGGGRVANTCNRSENYIEYSTKYGDMAGDFAPLANYTVREILALGHALSELPDHLVDKTPADGLCGKTDEERFGFTYDALDTFLLTGVCENAETFTKIQQMHEAGRHKRTPMPVCPKYGKLPA